MGKTLLLLPNVKTNLPILSHAKFSILLFDPSSSVRFFSSARVESDSSERRLSNGSENMTDRTAKLEQLADPRMDQDRLPLVF